MSMPWPEDVPALADDGVRGIVSLTEWVPEGLPDPRFDHLHLPVRDFTPPTQEQLVRALDFMDAVVAGGGAVAVHCAGGLGRTGTVVAAWLVRHGRTAAEAIREVRRRRPGSVETREQEQAVARFAASSGGG